MIPEGVLGAIAECDHNDALPILQRLRERVGQDTLRDAFFDLLETPAAGDDWGFEFFPAPALIAHFGEPPPMLIEGLLPQNSLVLLAGKPKYGKSLAALDLALSVGGGGPVWGSYVVSRHGPVVYLAMEDGEGEVINRLLKHGVRKTDPEGTPHWNVIFSVTNRSLADPEVLLRLRRYLEEVKPVLLIVDTAREGLRIRDWNDAAEVSDKLRPLRELARSVCAVLLVAHNRKAAADDSGDEIAGSNAFTSSVDGWISATRKEDLQGGNRRLFLSIQGRGGMRGETAIEMDTHTLRFRTVGGDELQSERLEEQQQRRREKHQRLAQAVAALPGGRGTVQQIAEALGELPDTVRKQVGFAVQDGALEKTGEKVAGVGRGPKLDLYRVPQPPAQLTEDRLYPIGASGIPVSNPTNGNGVGAGHKEEGGHGRGGGVRL